MIQTTSETGQKVRWGILGAARVLERLLPAIIDAKNSELVAIASRRPGAALAALNQYAPNASSINAYDNLESLLNDELVDAVYIPLSNHEHAEWALRAIELGKHVLIEKPMALTTEDITKIELAAVLHGVKVMEGFMYRFHPQHGRVKAIIDSGAIGEIRHTHSSFSFFMGPSRLYRIEKDTLSGGGAMWDIGPYAIHTARLWFDEQPKSVMAFSDFSVSGADTSTSGVINYGGGKFAHFDVSFEKSRQSEYTIIGTKGGIRCHTTWQLPGTLPVITWWGEDSILIEERLEARDHFVLEIEHFSNCILQHTSPLLTLSDAKQNCALIVAALKSATTGSEVFLEDLWTDFDYFPPTDTY
jgi:D-xylose 1-dehydrogenase (NADP+, D-xylono-1,5-lactone-forming)